MVRFPSNGLMDQTSRIGLDADDRDLDHDAFSSNRAQRMNVIDFNRLEHDVIKKPVPTFWHHALARVVLHRNMECCSAAKAFLHGSLNATLSFSEKQGEAIASRRTSNAKM